MQRKFRLKKRAAFAYVYKKGEKSAVQDMILLAARSREGLKIGLSVSKKVGNAVTRNRVKRLLREGLVPLTDRLDRGYMYVIVAKPSLAKKNYFEVRDELGRLFSKAGKLNGEGDLS